MLALRACFDPFELVGDGLLDRLVIAELKMQERVIFNRAPMPAEQRIGTDEIQRAAEAGVAARRSRPAMTAVSLIADTGWCSAVASTRIMIFSRL